MAEEILRIRLNCFGDLLIAPIFEDYLLQGDLGSVFRLEASSGQFSRTPNKTIGVVETHETERSKIGHKSSSYRATIKEKSMAIKLDVSSTEDIAIVRCHGWIVFGEEADELKRLVLALVNETERIVLNLAWIGHIDSSGLGTLVASFISAQNRGAEIKLAALSPKARRVLKSTHVDRLFEIYDSTEEAIKSFHPHPEAAAR